MVETTNSPDSGGLEKKIKISDSSEDRISQLPDSLIHHILSFLDDTRHVIQTTWLISKRWRPLWTSLSNLHFCDMMFYSSETEWISRFIQFVDTVLLLRDSSDIKKFHLSCSYSEWETETTHISTWILVAVRRNVQKLVISLPQGLDFQFPPYLFTSTSLMHLSICSFDGHVISEPYPVDLPKLKYLALWGLSIHVNLANKIFSGSPSLETLLLDSCYVKQNGINLNISSPKLKHLTLDKILCLDENEVVTVKLYAPELKFFSCKDYMERKYHLDSFDCLETAVIEMGINEPEEQLDVFSGLSLSLKEFYAQRMMSYLGALHRVEDLTLAAGFLEVMMGVPDSVHRPPIQFRNLRRLKLDTWLARASFRAITYLLQISPNIEYLSVEVDGVEGEDQHFPYVDEITSSAGNNVEDWEAGSSLSCILYHLKFVKIKGLLGCVNELKLLEILLKKSVALQKFDLFSARFLKSSVTEKRMKIFSEMVLSFPRTSEAANVVFQFRFYCNR